MTLQAIQSFLRNKKKKKRMLELAKTLLYKRIASQESQSREPIFRVFLLNVLYSITAPR
jgi:hypothetical protein